ncbi:MAG TPA: hypothetical protein PKY81_11955 [bacterium]|nr:hypothetical protein [bacterium]
MRKISYISKNLYKLFIQKNIITINDIIEELGTKVKMTIFRKLKELSYTTSYSHAGKYYVLNERAKYNEYGIWQLNNILFSIKGTLSNTLQNLIEVSKSGYYAYELTNIVKIKVEDSLYNLYVTKKINRHEINGKYLYLSKTNYAEQYSERQKLINKKENNKISVNYSASEFERYLKVFLSTLNEKQRRLYVGFESMKIGYGGDKKISKITGIDVKTIAAGRNELLNNNINSERIRKEGAGRHSIKKKQKSSLNLKN